MSNITRRHFLISGSTLLGACFLPAYLLRRIRDHQLSTNNVLIEGPARAQHTLFATEQDKDVWILGLDNHTNELPPAPTWRKWLTDYQDVDPDDRIQFARWIRDNRDDLSGRGPSRYWLDSEIPDYRWEQYLEGSYAIHDSPEAQALYYLEGLGLAHSPIVDSDGQDIGEVRFYHGTMPGADWHFVNVEGQMILPALQHRLRELGEDTAIEVVT